MTTAFAGAVPTTGVPGTAPITTFTAPPVAPVVPIVALVPITIEPLVVLSCSSVIWLLFAVIVALGLTRISEFPAPVFFKASKLTNPVPPPFPALIGPATVMLPNGAPTTDCVKTVILVPAVNVPSVTLPESATKIGLPAVMFVMVNGPGPANVSVYDDPADDVPSVTAVVVCVSMIFEKPVPPVVDEKFVLTIGNAPALSVPILPVPLVSTSVPPWISELDVMFPDPPALNVTAPLEPFPT